MTRPDRSLGWRICCRIVGGSASRWSRPRRLEPLISIGCSLQATKAGVPCIGLATGGIDHHVLSTAGAVQVYATPADLLDAFDESHLASLVR